MATPDLAAYTAEAEARQTEDIAARAEDRRALTESLLGTEAQTTGQLGGVSAELLPYTQRYALDPTLALQSSQYLPGQPRKKKKKGFFKKLTSAFTNPKEFGKALGSGGFSLLMPGGGSGGASAVPGTFYRGPQGTEGMQEYLYAVEKDANSFLQAAQDAAQAGDFATAEQLKNQAERYISESLRRSEFAGMGPALGSFFNLQEDPTTRAKSQLGSPAAQTIGSIVKRGRELTDPNSAEYQRTLSELQAPTREALIGAERAIASGARGAERYAKGVGAARGAARSIAQETAAYANLQRQTALDRANAITEAGIQLAEANKFMTTVFAPQFATNAAGLARSWAAGEAGTRDEYIASVGNLNQSIAGFSMSLAEMYNQQQMLSMQLKSQEKIAKGQQKAAIIGSVIQGVGGLAGGAAALCHGAAAVFGWFTPDWHAARNWIVEGWTGWKADLFRAFYARYSRHVGWAMNNIPLVKSALTPFFMWCRDQGRNLNA